MSEPKKPTTTRTSKAKVPSKVKKSNNKSASQPQSKMVTGLVFLFTALCIIFAILVLYRYGA